ncbi:MAG: hypothetical protein Tsb0013_01280 [Phycisphaerales bacterium]
MKTTLSAVAVIALAGAANAQTIVAGQDFDGGALNLITSNVINQDGGGGDAFGVGSFANWFQGTGVPFGLADDSVVDVSGGTYDPLGAFPGDDEGVYGQNSDPNNNFFGISDSDEFGLAQTASWTFDVSGFTDLRFSVDMGGVTDGDFGGYTSQTISFELILDGNSLGTLDFNPATNDGSFTARTMDNGNITGLGGVLQASSAFGVSKTNADTGLLDSNLYVDKATLDTGELDTFTTGIFSAAGGSTLDVVVTADFAFEAAAFDNLAITGVPAPGAAALLGLAGFAGLRRRRA